MKSGITWRRTFPECAPGTDGVALFEGRVIGRVRLLAEAARETRSPGCGASPTRPSPDSQAGPTRREKCPRAGKPWTA